MGFFAYLLAGLKRNRCLEELYGTLRAENIILQNKVSTLERELENKTSGNLVSIVGIPIKECIRILVEHKEALDNKGDLNDAISKRDIR